MSEFSIRVAHLVKDFEVYDRPKDIALELLLRRKRHRTFRALDDVSFDVRRGEVMGIIGHNGAGKSTLLKIVTGVLDATSGTADVAGRVTAILELGLGFNHDRPGRDNIHLSGLLYGMSKAEIDSKIASIIEFSGLGDFINMPVKTYSSGMQARLAFSIATAADPDILIIDEALAAGDAMFVQKSLRRIRQLCSGGRTVLVVSHGTSLLAQLCQRVIWLETGRIRSIGPAMNVIQAYDLAAHQGADSESWIETIPEFDAAVPMRPTVSGGSSVAPESVKEPKPANLTSANEATVAVEPGTSLEESQQTDATSHIVGAVALTAGSITLPKVADAVQLDTFGPADPASNLEASGKQVLRRGPIFIDKFELLDHNRNTTTALISFKPYTIRIAYHCKGPLPEESLGIALSVNQDGDLAPIMQWYTHNILPTEAREQYNNATFRRPAYRRGVVELGFNHVPFRAGAYILSIGLLPNIPGAWQFWEYRHLYYRFTVSDGGLGIGAFVYLEPHFLHSDLADEDTGAAEPLRLPPLTLGAEIREICFKDGKYPENWPHHAHCPACGGTTLIDAFSKFGFSHRRCGACEFVFMDPYPPEDILKRLYEGHYYTNIREFFEAPLLRKAGESTPFSASVEELDRIVDRATAGRTHGDWLDVGGGLGAFAQRIKNRLPDWRVVLNEYNPRSIEIAKSLGHVETTAEDIDALSASGRKLDVISFVAVLEHIPEPKIFIEKYAHLLRPAGVLAIIVPNFTRLTAQIAQASSAAAAPPFHLSLFNKANLVNMIRSSGLFETVDAFESGPPAFSLMHHIPFSNYFDITIPTAMNPTPATVMPTQYDEVTGQRIAALADADKKMAEYFAETDGRILLTVLARKRN